MIITVRRDDNEMEATYEVDENEQTIFDLKEKIAENNFGPVVEEQRLEYNNKRLKNSHFISYYNIKNKSIIVMKLQSASTSSSCSSTPEGTDDETEPVTAKSMSTNNTNQPSSKNKQ